MTQVKKINELLCLLKHHGYDIKDDIIWFDIMQIPEFSYLMN
jgi:hypothetical protein